MNNEQETILIQKKADAYWVLGNKVHISLVNGNWKRGIIKEVKKDSIILDESLEGLTPLFFIEIRSISSYTPKNGSIR